MMFRAINERVPFERRNRVNIFASSEDSYDYRITLSVE